MSNEVKYVKPKTKTKVIEVEPEKFVIELDREDAEVLYALLGVCSANTLGFMYSRLSSANSDEPLNSRKYRVVDDNGREISYVKVALR